MATASVPTVLFVCVHNAGRSQMAAGLLTHLAGDRVRVRSAGSEPADRLNPAVVTAMAEVGIDIAIRVDEDAVREKSLALTELFMRLVETRLAHHPLTLITPTDPARRGSHVSYRHPEGFAVMKALIAEGVIGDYREPGVLRFGIAPLYVGYAAVWDAVETLRLVLDEERWRAPEFQVRGAVT